MDKFTLTYKNMSHKESIGYIASQWCPTPNINKHHITVGPNSKLTRTCSTTFDGPYLTFDYINWNDILIIDLKIEAFLTEIAQKVLNKSIFNSNENLLIQLHVGQSHETDNGIIIQEAFNYFNQVSRRGGWLDFGEGRIDKIQKKIYLEYIIINQQQNYLQPLINMKTDMFYDIEIHTLWEEFKKNEHLTVIEKRDNFYTENFSNRQEM